MNDYIRAEKTLANELLNRNLLRLGGLACQKSGGAAVRRVGSDIFGRIGGPIDFFVYFLHQGRK